MRAWWVYWLTVAAGVILWLGVAIATPRGGMRTVLDQPLWFLVLLAPIALAGLNLILFRKSHETTCRLEVARHPWLRYLVGRGYSAQTFALTGLALLLVAGAFIAARLAGGI